MYARIRDLVYDRARLSVICIHCIHGMVRGCLPCCLSAVKGCAGQLEAGGGWVCANTSLTQSYSAYARAAAEKTHLCKPEQNSWKESGLWLVSLLTGDFIASYFESHYCHLVRLDFDTCKGEFNAK